jgi:3-hydroxyacyl-CoA dehydrogenase
VTVQGSSPEKSEAQAERLRKRGADFKNGTGETPEVTAAITDDEFHDSQVILEAIKEDVDAKNKFVFEISRAVGQDCIIASNTSSFPISHLAQMSNKPERVIGLHFFSPIDRMPLVEVITHERTNSDVLKRAIALVGQLGKVPVVIKDSPGFLVNRLLVSFIFEATLLAEEGVPLNWIDEAAVNFGMPMGPFALLDHLGWTLGMGVGDVVNRKFGERLKPALSIHKSMNKLIDEIGDDKARYYLVDDSGKHRGFDESTISKLRMKLSSEKPSEVELKNICDRLFLPMVDEATRCLEEKVVRKARDVDLAIIVGAGFPAFRGGLLRYADDLGIDYVVTKLEEIYAHSNSVRTVSKMLKSMQEVGRRYYGLGSGD